EVNKIREILNIDPVSEVASTNIVENISTNKEESKVEKINPDIFRKDIDNLLKCLFQDNQVALKESNNQLCDLLKQIQENEELKRDFSRHRLLELGMGLIEDDGSCPLCLTPWSPNELKKLIEKRITQVESAKKLDTQIKEKSGNILQEFKNCIQHIETVILTLRKAELPKPIEILCEWQQNLLENCKKLEDPIENYQANQQEKLSVLFAPANIESILEEAFGTISQNNPKPTSQDTAIQTLIRLSTL
ncbi:MAG: hypothetical protein NTY22_07750, partial [Proteobacteria bacterium]|nr:hypothetical protein [Pseudomonadota bacterium]